MVYTFEQVVYVMLLVAILVTIFAVAPWNIEFDDCSPLVKALFGITLLCGIAILPISATTAALVLAIGCFATAVAI